MRSIIKSIRLKHDWDNYWIDSYQRSYPRLIRKVNVDWSKLYSFDEACPEKLPKTIRGMLCQYAYSTYTYLSVTYLSTYLPIYWSSIYLSISILSLHLKCCFSYIRAGEHFDLNIQLMNLKASSMSLENHTVDMSWAIFKVHLSNIV